MWYAAGNCPKYGNCPVCKSAGRLGRMCAEHEGHQFRMLRARNDWSVYNPFFLAKLFQAERWEAEDDPTVTYSNEFQKLAFGTDTYGFGLAVGDFELITLDQRTYL